MPSTTRKTLKTLFRAFARSATVNLDKAESQCYAGQLLALDATTDVAETAIFSANGPVYVKSIFFVPTAASVGHATDNRVITIKNKGVAGAGTTEVVAYTTTLTAPANGFAAFVKKAIYAPVSPGLYLADGSVLSSTITHGAGGVALSGTIVVEFTPVID